VRRLFLLTSFFAIHAERSNCHERGKQAKTQEMPIANHDRKYFGWQ